MVNKKTLFEKLINDIKRIWRIAPRGLILWNTTIVVILIVPIFFSVDVFLGIQLVASFLAFGIMLDNDVSNSSRNLWILATGFALFCGFMMLIFSIGQFSYKWTFGYLIEQDEFRRLRVEKEEREEAKAKQKYQNIFENKNKEKKIRNC